MDFAHLPAEIQSLICNFLTIQDFTHAVRVSKAFYDIFSPYIWTNINISTINQYQEFTTREAKAGLAKHGHHVKTLETTFYWTLKHLVSSSQGRVSISTAAPNTSLCTGLKYLILPSSMEFKDPFRRVSVYGKRPAFSLLDMNELLELLRHNPSLTCLKVLRVVIGHKELLKVISSSLRQLRVISLDLCYDVFTGVDGIGPDTISNFIARCPQTVESIEITVNLRCFGEDAVFAKVEECLVHPNLEKLVLKGLVEGHEERILLPILRGCTGLKLIQTPGMRCFFSSAITDALVSAGFTLEEVVVDPCDPNVERLKDDVIVRLIHFAGDRMRVIDLAWTESIGEPTGRAILANCRALKELSLLRCGGIPSSTMHAILCSATELQKYNTSFEGEVPWPYDTYLQAMDIIQSKWGCRNLRSFNAEIQGVPRPDVQVGINGYRLVNGGGPLHQGTFEESHSIQRQIYRQLGALTRLQSLGLGHDDTHYSDDSRYEVHCDGVTRYTDDGFQLTCLSMTLESGLDLLSGLKELEVLDVRRMAHRIGVPELDWMRVNWPKLKAIWGMFQEGYEGEPGVRAWMEAQGEPKIELVEE